jgi:hypothetical protein
MRIATHTAWFLPLFLATAILSGLSVSLAGRLSPIDELLSLATVMLVAFWVLADACRHRHRFPLTAEAYVLLFASVVAPAYLVWSRGWRGFGWLVLALIGWYAVAIGASLLGMICASVLAA